MKIYNYYPPIRSKKVKKVSIKNFYRDVGYSIRFYLKHRDGNGVAYYFFYLFTRVSIKTKKK